MASYCEITPCWGNTEPRAGWSVIGIKECSVVGFLSPLQFGACDSGFSFLGRGGEPAEGVIGDRS